MKKPIFFPVSFTHLMILISAVLIVDVYNSSTLAAEKLVVPISKSISVKAPGVKKVMAIKDGVVQVMNVTDDEILISGVGAPDSTQLIIWDKKGRRFFDVETYNETQMITDKFAALVANPEIALELFPDVAFLKGRAETEESSLEAERILKSLVKDRPVKNLISVGIEPVGAEKNRVELVRRISETLKLPKVRVSLVKKAAVASSSGGSSADYQVVLEGTVKDQNDFIRLQKMMEPFGEGYINLVTLEKPIQVVFQAYILQVNRSNENDLNINWGGANSLGGTLTQGTLNFFENPMSAFRGDAGPSLAAPIDNWPNPFKFGNLNRFDIVAAQVRAWEASNKAKVLANPKLLVYAKTSLEKSANFEGKPAGQSTTTTAGGEDEAKVVVSNKTYVSQPNPGGAATTMEIPAETNLTIRDLFVFNADELKFTVNAKQSDATYRENSAFPDVFTREVSTKIRMGNGETIVLGGLIGSNESYNESGIPGLSKIPVIGRIFKSKSVRKTENELVILLTPQIISQEPNLAKNKKFEVVPVPRRNERLEELHKLFQNIQQKHFPEGETAK
ncbi:MAG: hypothetical protein HQM10_15670 [Candidatus Riflebacteria bacterium]|nr:hypothetical protein [Candidatus Riflebacteria bacterium]